MKNFWLARRKKRELMRIAQIVKEVARRKLFDGLKGKINWPKKDIKTQP
jgi:hypothetical protein